MTEKNTLPQVFIDIAATDLMERVQKYYDSEWRLANICASTLPRAVEMIYSFTHGLATENLRFDVQTGSQLPSISALYPAAFVFENETHDLFGVEFTELSIDFKGHFYGLSVPTPMNPQGTQGIKSGEEN